MNNHIAYHMIESPHYDIKIETKGDTKQVFVKCTHWVNKDWIPLNPTFGLGFTDHEILTDFNIESKLYEMTGLKREIIWTY